MGAEASPRLEILLVEDDPGYARLLKEMLAVGPETYRVTHVETLEEAETVLQQQKFAVILVDLGLPDADGIDAVVTLRARAPRCPMVVLSGQKDLETAIAAMREGAQEYLIKGQSEGPLLPRAIRYAIERKKMQDFEQMLVGVVSHDLRAPLQAIALSAGALAQPLDDARRATVLTRLTRSTARATRLIHDLLDLTKIRLGGGMVLELRESCLNDLVLAMVEEHRAAHPARVIDLTAPEGSIMLDVDPGRIGQAFANVLGNAIQHSPADTAIVVRVTDSETDATVAIHNEGPPIPPELRPRIFEPLERAALASDDRSRGSIGLGLYIVTETLRAHGGTIDVDSSTERGTTFSVRLPRVRREGRSTDPGAAWDQPRVAPPRT